AGAADTAYVAWTYTTGAASGTKNLAVPASLTPGNYELHLLANNSWQRLAVSNTLTIQPTSLSASPTSIPVGGTITATWSAIGAPSATDWVVLVPTGAPDSGEIAWVYTTGTADGTRSLVVPGTATPGTYELRLFAHNTYQRLAVSNTITVQPTTVTAGPATV